MTVLLVAGSPSGRSRSAALLGAQFAYIGYDPAALRAEAILVTADSPIRSVAELKGRKVALNKGSNVHYLLVRLLEKHGLKFSDITPVYLRPRTAARPSRAARSTPG